MTFSRRNVRPRAFTLVELMVSMALVLVLILGVNAVFKMASDTVNAGQALAGANRDNRSTQSTIYHDFQTMVADDGPLLLIRSERVPAFRNAADEFADRDFDRNSPPAAQQLAILSRDMDNNNQEGQPAVPGELTQPLVYNTRNHRIDRIAFFSNHLFRRQTGTQNATTNRFLDVGTSYEAYVWYGHLRQPDFSSPPGATGRFPHRVPNDPSVPRDRKLTNFYATDWILGRSVTLLQEHVPTGQNYTGTKAGTANRPNLTPLSAQSEVREPNGRATGISFNWSTCDLADTSVATYRQAVARYDAWWKIPANQSGNQSWWQTLGEERFDGYPYPPKPLRPVDYARTVPVFVRGCTQFIVEYAGDFLGQNAANGEIVSTYLPESLTGKPQATDGQIDFVIVSQRLHPSQTTPDQVRKVRWYGMPRNTDLDNDTTNGPVIVGGRAATGGGRNNSLMTDVVPLRDALIAAGMAPGATLPWEFPEQFVNLDPQANYGARGALPPAANQIYYAKWGPTELARGSGTPRPKMLRVTMVVDDPNGRMGEGQTYEYVIDLP